MVHNSKCRQCHTEMHPETLGTVSGEDGGLKISMSGFPVMVCARGHRHFMVPDFPMKLLERVREADQPKLPEGRKKGLIFKEYLCGKCGEKLQAQAEAKPFGFEVKVEDFAPFRVEINAPIYRCSACGFEQLRDREEVRAQTPMALAQGFQAAGLKPQA